MAWRKGFFRAKKNPEYAYFEVLGLSTQGEAVGFLHKENGLTIPCWLKDEAFRDHEYVSAEKPKAVIKKTKQVWIKADGSYSDTPIGNATMATLTYEASE